MCEAWATTPTCTWTFEYKVYLETIENVPVHHTLRQLLAQMTVQCAIPPPAEAHDVTIALAWDLCMSALSFARVAAHPARYA